MVIATLTFPNERSRPVYLRCEPFYMLVTAWSVVEFFILMTEVNLN